MNRRSTRARTQARTQRRLALELLEGRQLLAVAPVGYLIEANAGSYQVPTNGNTVTAASVVAGTLPAGLTLNNSGLISGTPAASTQGTSSLTINVTPTVGSAYNQDLTLTILANQFVDPSPSANNGFGTAILVLSNGNLVVTSPYDDTGGTNAGAVYLFNGSTGALISTVRGSTASDNVGSGGITDLGNGNYVVRSQNWDNGTITDAGAVTWGSGTAGVTGVVSSTNSLVGSTASDQVGGTGVIALTNGNYVVQSDDSDNSTISNAGAVTWGSGTAGVMGEVSGLNSLVGPFASTTPTISPITNTFLVAMKSPSILATRSLLALSSTTVASSANPSTYGSSVTFTATVTSGATGTVQFYDGATPLGSPVTLRSGTASYATAALSVGSHSITAVYSGDASYASSTSATLSQTVTGSAPVVTNQPVGGTYLPGTTTTLSATATGAPTPTIQWQYFNGTEWVNIAGATSGSLNVVVSAGMLAQQYRAVFSNLLGSAPTTVATVQAATSVTSQILAVRSGLILNRTTGLYEGTITLKNTGNTALAALSILFSGLTAGVQLANASGTVSDGTPFLNTGPIAAGTSITVKLSFRKPTAATPVNYTALFYLKP